MTTALIILVLAALVVIYGILEYRVHIGHLNSIPIRIHINGTRGKSSVTRLIAAGLRQHGIRTFAKTTGTLPRMIIYDGTEYPIYRPSKANIIEQLRIIGFAARNKAEAIVIECMALQPHLQSLTELKFVKATHGVITNARPDHLDVMGPCERDVALALLGSTPYKGKLFTCERDYTLEFEAACKDRSSELVTISQEEADAISDEEINRFSYVEHKENVALALKVCESVGVPREVALKGMWSSVPDSGAMSEYRVSFFERDITFVNGFAANDPESSERIWNMAIERYPELTRRVMIINTRADRPDRSKQLGEAIPKWHKADKYVIIGSGSYILFNNAVESGLNPSLFINAEGMGVDKIFEELLGAAGAKALIMGIGNIAGPGMELVNYFRNRSTVGKIRGA